MAVRFDNRLIIVAVAGLACSCALIIIIIAVEVSGGTNCRLAADSLGHHWDCNSNHIRTGYSECSAATSVRTAYSSSLLTCRPERRCSFDASPGLSSSFV